MTSSYKNIVDIDGFKISLSNVDKILFPDNGISKAGLIDYYSRIAPMMLPHLKDRPISMQRFPNGINEQGFFQKEAPDYFPEFIEKVEIDYKEADDKWQACINNRPTLVYLANQGVITPHTWLSRKDKINFPDRLIFDLDPAREDEFYKIIRAAKCMKTFMEELGLHPYVMTTGSKGLHINIPIKPEQNFDEIRKGFAAKVAEIMVKRWPDDLTLEIRKASRKGRIFVDTLRNAYAQTAVAPYAVRPRPGAPIATPLEWDELNDSLTPEKYTIKNIFRRLGQKNDPWLDINTKAGSINIAEKKLETMKTPADIC